MTDEARQNIIGVAERLREAGVRVATRAVYDALGRKGSYNDVAAVVAEWRAETDYQPEVETHDLPTHLKVKLLDFGNQILGQVRSEQSAALDAERVNADARRRAYEAETAEAGAMVGQLLERVGDLQTEVAYLRALTGVEGPLTLDLAAGVDTLPRPGPSNEADQLWKRIGDEVRDLLGRRGPMWEPEILDALPAEIRRRSTQVGLPLFAGWLGFHLRRMADAREGIQVQDGRFALVEPVQEADAEAAPGRNAEATKFWRLVMLEIVAIVRRHARPMTAAEIVPELAPNTQAMAQRFEPIKPGMLAEKMRVRAAAKNSLFREVGEGNFDLSDIQKARAAA